MTKNKGFEYGCDFQGVLIWHLFFDKNRVIPKEEVYNNATKR